MSKVISGGRTTYGHRVGILMSDSDIPRIPGDPGHAETFNFPVVYGILKGLPFQDLIDIRRDNIDVLINKSLELEAMGVHLIAADCGLFAPFQPDMREVLSIPFIGSALEIIPLFLRFLPKNSKIGILTGDTEILTDQHLEASGIDPSSVCIAGMDNSSEFKKVVIDRNPELNIEQMREDVCEAVLPLKAQGVCAVVIECTNLISFRTEIQSLVGVPVYDLVSLIEYYISGFENRCFSSAFFSLT